MLKNHTFFRRLCAFWAVLTLLFAFALPAFADTGPKPSVEISFRNLPDTACFATLLSKERSTGPASAWDGDPDDLPQTDDPAQAAWNAFAQYRDRDGFFFLQPHGCAVIIEHHAGNLRTQRSTQNQYG